MNEVCEGEAVALIDILDRLAAEAEGSKVRLGDLFEAFGTRAFGPMLLVPAFLAVAPTGAIPGMSIATGSVIILIALQMLLPIDRPWLPKRLMDLEFSRSLFNKSVKKSRPYIKKFGKVVRPRFDALACPPWSYAVALVCIAMGALMFPLALLPFAVLAPGMVIVFLAVGLTSWDGVLIAIGLMGSVITLVMAYQVIL